MEKNEIMLSFDSEKMEALVFYLKKENTTVQKKMDEALRLLYEQTVPEPHGRRRLRHGRDSGGAVPGHA